MLGVPALIGGIPILIKLASTVTVLFLVASFYLGMAGAVKDADMAGAVAALSAVWSRSAASSSGNGRKFQRQSLLYQKILSENVYFRNVNNNAGIFDTIIGEAEEQECKEAFLAYYFLLAPGGGGRPRPRSMRGSRSGCARHSASTSISNATTRSASSTGSGLLRRDGDRLSVPPLDEALRRLDSIWDDFFPLDGSGVNPARRPCRCRAPS